MGEALSRDDFRFLYISQDEVSSIDAFCAYSMRCFSFTR